MKQAYFEHDSATKPEPCSGGPRPYAMRVPGCEDAGPAAPLIPYFAGNVGVS